MEFRNGNKNSTIKYKQIGSESKKLLSDIQSIRSKKLCVSHTKESRCTTRKFAKQSFNLCQPQCYCSRCVNPRTKTYSSNVVETKRSGTGMLIKKSIKDKKGISKLPSETIKQFDYSKIHQELISIELKKLEIDARLFEPND